MDSKKVFLKLSIALFFICLNSSLSFSQKPLNIEIKGNWTPQNSQWSCWAASLSNLTRNNWSKEIKSESYFWNKVPAFIAAKNIKTLFIDSVFVKDFNFEYTHDKVLTFESIYRNFKVKYPRPLIYSYGYDNGNGGHFTNIIGTRELTTTNPAHNKWLVIFDPKPDSIGSKYLKNYLTYQMVDTVQKSLQGTYFNISNKKIRRKQAVIQNEILDGNYTGSGLIRRDAILEQVDSILRNPELRDFIGEGNITYSDLFSIQINKDRKLSYDLVASGKLPTVEREIFTLFFPLCDGNFKGAAILQAIDNDHFIIDRIADISHFNKLKDFLRASIGTPQAKIINGKKINYYENKSLNLLDFDNGKLILMERKGDELKGIDLYKLQKESILKKPMNVQPAQRMIPINTQVYDQWQLNSINNFQSFDRILKLNR